MIIKQKYGWSDEQIRLLKENFGKENYESLSRKIGKTTESIAWKAKKLGLKNGRYNLYRKYNIQDSIFLEYSLESCYWAGFIAADGYIRDKYLSITLQIDDKNHLEKLKCFLGFTGDVTQHIRYHPPHINRVNLKEEYCRLSVNSKIIVDALDDKFGLTNCKTFILKPPTKIPTDELKFAYIVGFLDGDGWYSPKKGMVGVAGQLEMVQWIKDFFGSHHTIVPRKNRNGTDHILYQLNMCGKIADKIVQCIRSSNLPYLKRKWNYDNK